MNPEDYIIATTGETGFLTTISARAHELIADEPEAHGGTDLGPAPHDFLAAGLASCTTMTLQMYARRKKWPLEEAVAQVSYSKIENGSEKTMQFKIEIKLIGELNEEQQARMLAIAKKCPVHKTLTGNILMDVSIDQL